MRVKHTSMNETFAAMLEADSPEALLRVAERTIAALPDAWSLSWSALWLPLADRVGLSFALTRDNVHKHRFHRPMPMPAPCQALFDGSEHRTVVVPAGEVGELDLTGDEEDGPEPAAMLLLPLVARQRVTGVWGFRLDPGMASPSDELREGLEAIGAILGRILPRSIERAGRIEEHDRIRQVHDLMRKTMVTQYRPSLLAGLLSLLNRHFRFSRVMICLVNHESGALRNELHTGFKKRQANITASIEDMNHPLVRFMHQGQATLYEAGLPRAEWPEDMAELTRPEPERAALIPLRVDSHPLGVIYVDQPEHDGRPIAPGALETFGWLASVAIENQHARSQAERRAETDPLTGLSNRAYLNRVLEIEVPRVKRYNHPISLLMIDLCDFKHTNDSYGHQFGDYILRETANLIKANVRSPDIVVRYGGDEFVVLMVSTSEEQGRRVEQRITEAFIERNRLQADDRMMINISIGMRSADASNIEDLVHQADMAMYAQKARQKRQQLIRTLVAGNLEKIEAADRVVGSLCNMLFKKMPSYHSHACRVALRSLALGRRLDLDAEQLEILVLAALLHDIGKASVPTEILQKAEPLKEQEIQALRHHSALGEEFFQGIEHLEPLRPIIRAHHERWDGRMDLEPHESPAYPDGLCGERIPLLARVVRMAEFADGLLYDRPYRNAPGPEAAPEILARESGGCFDPQLLALVAEDYGWLDIDPNPEPLQNLPNQAENNTLNP